MAAQIIDGTLEEVREKLNALPSSGQRVRAAVWPDAAPQLSPWDVDANGVPFPSREETLAYLRERLQNPLTDPEEIRQADEEFEELQRNLNQNRIDAGERPLFPE